MTEFVFLNREQLLENACETASSNLEDGVMGKYLAILTDSKETKQEVRRRLGFVGEELKGKKCLAEVYAPDDEELFFSSYDFVIFVLPDNPQAYKASLLRKLAKRKGKHMIFCHIPENPFGRKRTVFKPEGAMRFH